MSAKDDKKTPEQKKQKLDEKVDQQMEDTFPASDPPSFSGGKHIIGAPQERESDAAGGEHPEVVKAEKKVKTGAAPVPHTY
jgi:hypothetical protein